MKRAATVCFVLRENTNQVWAPVDALIVQLAISAPLLPSHLLLARRGSTHLLAALSALNAQMDSSNSCQDSQNAIRVHRGSFAQLKTFCPRNVTLERFKVSKGSICVDPALWDAAQSRRLPNAMETVPSRTKR
jgi:hypothetical protein